MCPGMWAGGPTAVLACLPSHILSSSDSRSRTARFYGRVSASIQTLGSALHQSGLSEGAESAGSHPHRRVGRGPHAAKPGRRGQSRERQAGRFRCGGANHPVLAMEEIAGTDRQWRAAKFRSAGLSAGSPRGRGWATWGGSRGRGDRHRRLQGLTGEHASGPTRSSAGGRLRKPGRACSKAYTAGVCKSS